MSRLVQRSARRAILAALLLGAAGCGAPTTQTFVPVGTTAITGGDDARNLIANGRLNPDDPTDAARPGCHFKTYQFKMIGGTEYVIDLRSRDFDAYLRLLDADGKALAEDDDSGGERDARLVFWAPRTAAYRLVATSCTPQQTGNYTLHVRVPGETPSLETLRFEGQRTDLGDLVVLADTDGTRTVRGPTSDRNHGYVEYRLIMLNAAPAVSHRATVTIPRAENWMQPNAPYLQALRRSVTLAPQSVETLRLWQPNLPMAYGSRSLALTVDGTRLRTPVPLTLTLHRGHGQVQPNAARAPAVRQVLAAPALGTALSRHVLLSAVGRPPVANQNFGTTGGMHDGQPFVYVEMNYFQEALAPVGAWSRHWLGYSGYDGIAVRAAQLRAAPPEVHDALARYVECGGALVVVGTHAVPAPWQRTRRKLAGFDAYYPGFGQCLVARAEPDKWNVPQWQALTDTWGESAQPWQDVATAGEANARFPVVDDIAIPIRDLFVIMVAFAVVIGPVSVLVLAWLRRRIWLLWTVPVLSLVTCAAVIGYMSATEDWNGYARREGVTVLDETTGRATSIGWLGLYTPQTPADGLHFSYDTELSPHLAWTRHRDSSPRTLDWTSDQNLTSGWLLARIPAHFLVRTSEARDEHVDLRRRPDGTRELTNHLGAAITRLWLADADGKLYTAADIAPGGTATLTPTATRAAATGAWLRAVYARDWLKSIGELATKPERVLRPGSYLALLDGAPFLPTGLAAAADRRSRSAVLGILRTP